MLLRVFFVPAVLAVAEGSEPAGVASAAAAFLLFFVDFLAGVSPLAAEASELAAAVSFLLVFDFLAVVAEVSLAAAWSPDAVASVAAFAFFFFFLVVVAD